MSVAEIEPASERKAPSEVAATATPMDEDEPSVAPVVDSGAPAVELPTCEMLFDDVPAAKQADAVRFHLGQWASSLDSDTMYGVPVSFTEEQKESIREQLDLLLVDGKFCGLVEAEASWRE